MLHGEKLWISCILKVVNKINVWSFIISLLKTKKHILSMNILDLLKIPDILKWFFSFNRKRVLITKRVFPIQKGKVRTCTFLIFQNNQISRMLLNGCLRNWHNSHVVQKKSSTKNWNRITQYFPFHWRAALSFWICHGFFSKNHYNQKLIHTFVNEILLILEFSF